MGRVLNNYEEAITKYKKEIEDAGYDGLIIKDTAFDALYGGGNQYVAFEPTQIKSATDNVGTFNESNPSILFQTDTEYLNAVNSGDMAKAQAMVDARAREQGYTIKAYHGTNNSEETKTWNNERKEWDTKYAPITVFKRRVDGHRNKGHFFASDIDNAGGYGSKLYNVYLKIQDPLVIDCNGSLYSEIYYNGQTKDTYEWAEWAERTGYDGVIFLDIRDGVDYGALQTPLDEYVAFRANQIKSADPVTYDDNGNVIPLSQRFNEQNNSLLYQENEQTYEEATENGNYVPDDILQSYRGQEWADAEISAREDYRADASDYMAEGKDYEQFAEAMRVDDPQQRTDDYYKEIWNSASEINPKYEEAVQKFSKRMFEKIIRTLNRLNDDGELKESPVGIFADAMKYYKDNENLSDELYEDIMAEVESAPDKALVYIAEAFSDREDFDNMMRTIATTPDADAFSEINRYIKNNKHYKDTTVRNIDEDIKTIKGVIRDYRLNYITKEEARERLDALKDKYKGKLEVAKENEQALDTVTVDEAKKLLEEGHFAEGSMAPKIRAAIMFVENGGKECIITEAGQLDNPNCGTRIVR